MSTFLHPFPQGFIAVLGRAGVGARATYLVAHTGRDKLRTYGLALCGGGFQHDEAGVVLKMLVGVVGCGTDQGRH